uniref:Uncharacterized protein n=1 Tax=Arundo donax TaxID=35708 RepID=A0A0A8YMY7_ARUDO
MFFGSLLFH